MQGCWVEFTYPCKFRVLAEHVDGDFCIVALDNNWYRILHNASGLVIQDLPTKELSMRFLDALLLVLKPLRRPYITRRDWKKCTPRFQLIEQTVANLMVNFSVKERPDMFSKPRFKTVTEFLS